jgi:Fur family transcriptional regulator, ferric uptake regulator
VLEELAREPNDATAQQLHRRLRSRRQKIGLATVYRALGAMSEAGVVDSLSHGSETCYRLCGEGHHHHLVCESCHRVIELGGCPADGWIDRAAKRAGFVPTGHRLEVRGLCASCRR